MRILIAVLSLALFIGPPAAWAEEDVQGYKLNRWNILTTDHGDEPEHSSDESPSEKPNQDLQKHKKSETDDDQYEINDDQSGMPSRQDVPLTEDKAKAGLPPPTPGVNNTPAPLKETPPDRPWIIKQSPLPKGATLVPEGHPVQFMNEDQQQKCTLLLSQIKEAYLVARYYSIQGDGCSTADHAGHFLELVEQCQNECPVELLVTKGYDAEFIDHMTKPAGIGKSPLSGRGEIITLISRFESVFP